MDLKGKHVLLGVSSSVATYKACDLARQFIHAGAEVKVIMTKNATKLVKPRQFAELTGNPVAVKMFDEIKEFEIEHISLAQWADIVVVAPATYNVINKIACGIADDMLTTTIAAVPQQKTPVVFAPAMNTHMWTNPILQANIEKLKTLTETQLSRYGYYHFVGPISGLLACGDIGIGKMSEPADIVSFITNL